MTTQQAPARAGRRPVDLPLQTLRGVAILLVAAFHVRGLMMTGALRLPVDDPWSRGIDCLTFVRMPLFAFLGGFVYAMRPLRSDYLGFVRGKARRLLLPTVVVGSAYALLIPVGDPARGHAPGVLGDLVPVRQLWFVESLFWVFLVVGALDRAGVLRRLAPVVVLAAGAVAADTVLPVGGNLLGVRYAVYLLPFFVAGLAARRFDWRGVDRRWVGLAGAAAVPLVVVMLLDAWGVLDSFPARHHPVGAAAAVATCLLLIRSSWVSPPLAWLGNMAFTVYLVHIFGIVVTGHLLDRVGLTATTPRMLLGIVGGVGLGVLVDLVARRSRWTRLLILGKRLPPSGRHRAADPARARAGVDAAVSR